MARKDVLKGLMEGTTTPPAPPADITPRTQRGAIGAVSQSIADLKARSVVELDPFMIEAGGVQDRVESVGAEDAELARSISEYGQQVPILVRPHPEKPGRFQIVYGRRRVLAARELGIQVKALIRDLDDTGVVMAQGQENSVRRDLSFIEKVVFVMRLDEAGYNRKAICDAVNVDKTQVSRMLSIGERIPFDVIHTIGAVPTVGRDRWEALADFIATDAPSTDALPDMIGALSVKDDAPDARFEAALAYMRKRAGQNARDAAAQADLDIAARAAGAGHAAPEPAQRTSARKTLLKAADGMRLGEVVHGVDMVTLRLRKTRTKGFEDWLIASLPDLHRQWEEGPDTPLPTDDEAP